MTYYDICREARERQNISKKDVARACNYSVANIHSFENSGTNNARLLMYYIQNILENADIIKLRYSAEVPWTN